MAGARQIYRLVVEGLSVAGPRPPLKVEFDLAARVLYVRVRTGKVVRSAEFGRHIVGDFDRHGDLLGFEVLDLSRAGGGRVPDRMTTRSGAKDHPNPPVYQFAEVG